MILQMQRLLRRVRYVECRAVVVGESVDLDVVLDQDAVVQHRDPRAIRDLPLLVELRRVENDVVGLPFSWLARCVHERCVLLVNRAGLTVEIGPVVV